MLRAARALSIQSLFELSGLHRPLGPVLRLGSVDPIDALIVEEMQHAGRDVDHRMPFGWSRASVV